MGGGKAERNINVPPRPETLVRQCGGSGSQAPPDGPMPERPSSTLRGEPHDTTKSPHSSPCETQSIINHACRARLVKEYIAAFVELRPRMSIVRQTQLLGCIIRRRYSASWINDCCGLASVPVAGRQRDRPGFRARRRDAEGPVGRGYRLPRRWHGVPRVCLRRPVMWRASRV